MHMKKHVNFIHLCILLLFLSFFKQFLLFKLPHSLYQKQKLIYSLSKVISKSLLKIQNIIVRVLSAKRFAHLWRRKKQRLKKTRLTHLPNDLNPENLWTNVIGVMSSLASFFTSFSLTSSFSSSTKLLERSWATSVPKM